MNIVNYSNKTKTMSTQLNKNNFFGIVIKNDLKITHLQHVLNKLDIVISKIGITENPKIYIKKDNKQIVALLRTNIRKRKGQIIKICEKVFENNVDIVVNGLTKAKFNYNIEALDNKDDYKKIFEHNSEKYTGKDLQVFEDKNNYYKWQKQVYNILFDENDNVKDPEQRIIYNIVDETGNSGKSSFFKYLSFKFRDKNIIGRIGYGRSQQIATRVIKMGPRKIYIIDLTRAVGKYDSQEDLISAIEEIKNGFVSSAMYGSTSDLIFDPPHVIISSNYCLEYENCSEDRWKIYRIKKDRSLGRENQILNELKAKENIKKQSKDTRN